MAVHERRSKRRSGFSLDEVDCGELGVTPIVWGARPSASGKRMRRADDIVMRLDTVTPPSDQSDTAEHFQTIEKARLCAAPTQSCIQQHRPGGSSRSPDDMLRYTLCDERASASAENPFDQLSHELLVNIIQFIPKRQLRTLGLTCKRFYLATMDPAFWNLISLYERAMDSLTFNGLLQCNPRVLRAVACVVSGPTIDMPLFTKTMSLTRLRALSIPNCDITDDHLVHVISHASSQLIHIDLTGLAVTDRVLQCIAATCPDLAQLNLRMMTRITDDGVLAIVRSCRKLKILNVAWSGLTSAGIRQLVTSLPELVEVDLSGSGDNLTDDDILALTVTCKKLQVIEISDCYALTDTAVQHMIDNCAHLFAVSMSRCHNITMAMLLRLINKPNLKHVNMFGCSPDLVSHIEHLNRALSFNRCAISFVDLPFPHQALELAVSRDALPAPVHAPFLRR
eukprot:m.46247 g.46247  ORF g.46247 m.46247 type:complete len:453 (+) comp5917_c0_seq1:57-1415(+)